MIKFLEKLIQLIDFVNNIGIEKFLISFQEPFNKYISKFMNIEVISNPIKAYKIVYTHSITFQRGILFLDTWNFIEILKEIIFSRIRGSITIIVLDYQDIRRLCHDNNLILLEPWNFNSFKMAIEESIEYSEVFEIPYIIRITPELLISIEKIEKQKFNFIKRVPTFNKHWKEFYRWNIIKNLQEVYVSKIFHENFELILKRCENVINIHKFTNDEILNVIEQCLYNNINVSKGLLILSLYQNPWPKRVLKNLKFSELNIHESSNFLINVFSEFNPRQIKIEDIVQNRLNIFRDCVMYIHDQDNRNRVVKSILGMYFKRNPSLSYIVSTSFTLTSMVEQSSEYGKFFETKFINYEPRNVHDVTDLSTDKYISVIASTLSKIFDRNVNIVELISCNEFLNECSLIELPEFLSSNSVLVIICDRNCERCILKDFSKAFPEIEFVEISPEVKFDELIFKLFNKKGIKILKFHKVENVTLEINYDKCDLCRDCLFTSCNAIKFSEGRLVIDQSLCTKCFVCKLLCTRKAIQLKKI